MKGWGPITIVGAGSWGTALAKLLADQGLEVRLWVYEQEVCEALVRTHTNPVYLPDVELAAGVVAIPEFAEALDGAAVVCFVVPSHVLRRVAADCAPCLPANAALLSATKGIEVETGMLPAQVLADVLGENARDRLAVLSGPSFAVEVARGLPTAVTIAAHDDAIGRRLQETFATPVFRVYLSSDVTGVQLGGAVKNVIAIATGIADGLGLGHNARAALITRGLAEIMRLGQALGADPLTLSGLSGLGDLVLTCTSELSRNRTLGYRIGRGEALDRVTRATPMVAEGVRTSAAAVALAERLGVEVPISRQVHAILHEGKRPLDAVHELLARTLKAEKPNQAKP
ncbi:MAG: NAD(P)-dependent glycerol-3-phosphate dehydrogenase [Verrucomicrobia bacterium]|nr:NAD(P)-dependent glycerol-3-phosphate dehydrogenase [Verrucomicrobiota bacterium]